MKTQPERPKREKRLPIVSSHGACIQCTNCGRPLKAGDRFCPGCGQKDQNRHIPLRRLISEMVEGILHFDGKSVQTIEALVLKPGYLTSEYINGRRVRYVAPVKLYIFISFMFFLLVALPGEEQTSHPGDDGKPGGINLTLFGINSLDVQGMNQAQLDSVIQVRSIEPTAVNRYIVRQLARIGSPVRGEFARIFGKLISYMMFVLMPVFALAVYWLHRKKAGYYIGPLIFSIHYHCAVFLLLSIFVVINRFLEGFALGLIPLLLPPVYLFVSLRRVYRDPWPFVALKSILVLIFHAVSFVVLLAMTAFIGVLIY